MRGQAVGSVHWDREDANVPHQHEAAQKPNRLASLSTNPYSRKGKKL